MEYLKFIRNIKSIESKKYKNVSSREKLAVYAMKYLENNNIPLSFNFICVATFKLFPERFHLGDFNEYPHIEMLNRTILHLRPKENNYAEGTAKLGYKITKLGYYIAEQVENELRGESQKGKPSKVKIDQIKKMPSNLANKYFNSKLFEKWKKENKLSDDDFWSLFEVIPFSRPDYIKSEIKELIIYSKEEKNKDNIKFSKYLDIKFKNLF